MEMKILVVVAFCMAFIACNLNLDKKKVEEETTDAVEMIDAATSNHLAFKGVPIDGTLNQYVARMKKVGFKHVDTENGAALLRGDFAGYKDCEVYVSTLAGNDIVSYITVDFPKEDTWEYLYGDYKSLKELLIEKYGQPSSVKEEFQGYKYSLETDKDKMHKVRMDECKYETLLLRKRAKLYFGLNMKA